MISGTLLLVYLALIFFLIYIAPILLIFASIIFVLTRKKIEITNRILIVAIILLVVFMLFITFIKFRDVPSDNYTKYKQINDIQSVVGLSKEEVENTLGKPNKTKNEENIYLYNAGSLFRDISFLHKFDLYCKTYYYALYVYFDDNDTVKSTSMKETMEFYVP